MLKVKLDRQSAGSRRCCAAGGAGFLGGIVRRRGSRGVILPRWRESIGGSHLGWWPRGWSGGRRRLFAALFAVNNTAKDIREGRSKIVVELPSVGIVVGVIAMDGEVCVGIIDRGYDVAGGRSTPVVGSIGSRGTDGASGRGTSRWTSGSNGGGVAEWNWDKVMED